MGGKKYAKITSNGLLWEGSRNDNDRRRPHSSRLCFVLTRPFPLYMQNLLQAEQSSQLDAQYDHDLEKMFPELKSAYFTVLQVGLLTFILKGFVTYFPVMVRTSLANQTAFGVDGSDQVLIEMD